MNQRIRELAEQAVKETQSLMIMEYKNFESKLYEKFAELIVRECAEQVITGPNGPAHYAVEAAIRLKKHFGVEE